MKKIQNKRNAMKGQSQMMEYLLMLVIIVAVILVLMLFLTWWQLSQLRAEQSESQQNKALNMLSLLSDSPYLVKEDSMMDSGKLTALAMLSDSCDMLMEAYGQGWHANVRLLDGKPVTPCSQSNYPDCNYWELCPEQSSGGRIVRVIPVNVYHNIGYVLSGSDAVLPRTYPAILNVTVYV